ncbi:MAG: M55 family metallopeptidase [Myxococcales bacterium]|nr:M55 family metallopeptidase [Myxococcales bacterium]
MVGKVYISADIEGVTGIAHWDEANASHAAYGPFQERMNVEVAAACEGALQGGATEVWVKDAHHTGRNLDPARLPRPTRLIRGWSGHPFAMVQELDASFAALALVGYHAPAANGGNPLSHTMSSAKFHRLLLNDEPVSELRLHAWIARSLGVPTVFVSGDAAICEEAEQLDPAIATVVTGRGVGHSMVGHHPRVVEEQIRSQLATAVRRAGHRQVPPLPDRFVLDVEFRVHHAAYRASQYPGATLVHDNRVRLTTSDYLDVPRALLFW